MPLPSTFLIGPISLDDQFEFTLSDPPPDRPPPLFDVDIVFIVKSANRPPDDFKFDGGDRLTSVGGAIAFTLTFWIAPLAGELSDGTLLPACRARTTVNLKPELAPPPTPAPTFASPPSQPPDQPTPTPPPSTTPTPTATSALLGTPVAPTTVFPMDLLPETGTREFKYEERAFSGGFLLLVLVSSLVVIYFWARPSP